jgi:hypothetical protein
VRGAGGHCNGDASARRDAQADGRGAKGQRYGAVGWRASAGVRCRSFAAASMAGAMLRMSVSVIGVNLRLTMGLRFRHA